ERRHVRLLRNSHHHADAPYSLRLLRVRGNRPRYGRNATDHFDKLAPPHAAISLRLRKTHGIGSSHHRKRGRARETACPLGVKSRHVQCTRAAPLTPQKRTSRLIRSPRRRVRAPPTEL